MPNLVASDRARALRRRDFRFLIVSPSTSCTEEPSRLQDTQHADQEIIITIRKVSEMGSGISNSAGPGANTGKSLVQSSVRCTAPFARRDSVVCQGEVPAAARRAGLAGFA